MVLTRKKINSEPGDLRAQKQILNSLSERQMEWLRQHTYRTDFNWHTGYTELSIRKSSFSAREYTEMLFLFPQAQARSCSIR